MPTQPLMARRIKAESNLLCDWQAEGHRQVIPKGSYAVQVVGDETIPAQGLYHGSGCYQSALAKYQQLKKEIEDGNA